jgi:hypothetical protein
LPIGRVPFLAAVASNFSRNRGRPLGVGMPKLLVFIDFGLGEEQATAKANAGPSTAPLAMRLRETSLGMTLLFSGLSWNCLSNEPLHLRTALAPTDGEVPAQLSVHRFFEHLGVLQQLGENLFTFAA